MMKTEQACSSQLKNSSQSIGNMCEKVHNGTLSPYGFEYIIQAKEEWKAQCECTTQYVILKNFRRLEGTYTHM